VSFVQTVACACSHLHFLAKPKHYAQVKVTPSNKSLILCWCILHVTNS
jgi:hypothetical protein